MDMGIPFAGPQNSAAAGWVVLYKLWLHKIRLFQEIAGKRCEHWVARHAGSLHSPATASAGARHLRKSRLQETR